MNARDKQMLIHRHNGFFGTSAMARGGMIVITRAQTTNSRAKDTAQEIIKLLDELDIQLKDRVDPE